MSTTDIPRRCINVFETPLDVKTCGQQLAFHKVQCSECNEMFTTEFYFAIHIHECMQHADRESMNYQVHLHANRLVLMSDKVAGLCGSFANVECKECVWCKDVFEEEALLKEHIKVCYRYKTENMEFMRNNEALFTNIANAHKALGLILQTYIFNASNTMIIENMESEPSEIKKEEEEEPVDVNHVLVYICEKMQAYQRSLDDFIDDVFIRYLARRKATSMFNCVQYSFPDKDVDEEDDEELVFEMEDEEDADDELSETDEYMEEFEIDVVN